MMSSFSSIVKSSSAGSVSGSKLRLPAPRGAATAVADVDTITAHSASRMTYAEVLKKAVPEKLQQHSVPSDLYHEKQDPSTSLCGMHALNSVFHLKKVPLLGVSQFEWYLRTLSTDEKKWEITDTFSFQSSSTEELFQIATLKGLVPAFALDDKDLRSRIKHLELSRHIRTAEAVVCRYSNDRLADRHRTLPPISHWSTLALSKERKQWYVIDSSDDRPWLLWHTENAVDAFDFFIQDLTRQGFDAESMIVFS